MASLPADPISKSDIIELYKEYGAYERHFNNLQNTYRGLASTWFLAAFAGVSFFYSSDFGGGLPISRELTASLITLAGGTGIVMLWLMDVLVYHRLLLAVISCSEQIESQQGAGFLPTLRQQMALKTQNLQVRTAISIYYIMPTIILSVASLGFLLSTTGLPFYAISQAIIGLWAVLLLGFAMLTPFVQRRSLSPVPGVSGVLKLIIVAGLPGSGKTTAAKIIGDYAGAVVLRTDEIRKKLFYSPAYTPNENQQVYDELMCQADTKLAQHRPVVLDATFHRRQNRDRAINVAQKYNASVQMVEIICPDEAKLVDHLSHRTRDASDADFQIYQGYKNISEPIEGPHITIDNTGTLDDLKRKVVSYLS